MTWSRIPSHFCMYLLRVLFAFLGFLASVVIGQSNYFGSGLRYSIENFSMLGLLAIPPLTQGSPGNEKSRARGNSRVKGNFPLTRAWFLYLAR